MFRLRDRMWVGALAAAVVATAMGPFVVSVVQVIRDPPPEHADLMMLVGFGEAIDRLVWGSVIVAVAIAFRAAGAAIRRHRRRQHRWDFLAG